MPQSYYITSLEARKTDNAADHIPDKPFFARLTLVALAVGERIPRLQLPEQNGMRSMQLNLFQSQTYQQTLVFLDNFSADSLHDFYLHLQVIV